MNTEVGKKVKLKFGEIVAFISKNIVLGRLETSAEFKERQPAKKIKTEIEIDTLKIFSEDINDEDRSKRNLSKNSKGSIILQIYNRSPFIWAGQ